MLENLSWGVAGRNEEKLKQVLKEMGDKAGKDLSSIPIIIADVKDENSLVKMAERAKVINTNIVHSIFLYTHNIVAPTILHIHRHMHSHVFLCIYYNGF